MKNESEIQELLADLERLAELEEELARLKAEVNAEENA